MNLPAHPNGRTIVAAVTLVIAALLLFVHLGRYALWDDEAYTALTAKAILATGDTSAVVGNNIVAFRGGLVLQNLKDRSTPPLPAYLLAPFIAIGGETAFVARLPFALLGLATISLMLFWIWREAEDLPAVLIFCIAIIGNVSLFLYLRNSRYYAASIFLTVSLAYLYTHFRDWRTLSLMILVSIALFPTNYLHYVAIYLCLAVDYLIWGRHRRKFTWREFAILLAPQIVAAVIIASIWNPLRVGTAEYQQRKTMVQWFELMYMHLRDLNRCEFGPILLLAAAPILFFFTRNRWLLRGALALLPFIVVAAILSPQDFPPGASVSVLDADVRYIVPLIPLCIGLASLVLCQTRGVWRWVAAGLAVPCFWTNGPHQVVRLDYHVSSALWKYLGELHNPPPDPYTPTARWINDHVQPNESIWVVPNFAFERAGIQIYPLMYHAPKAIYAWQLEYPPKPQFAHLPEIHFAGRVAPDYIIAFGPIVFDLIKGFRPPPGITYDQVDTLDVFYKDLYRPELFWRQFRAVPADALHGTAIYIFKKRLIGSTISPPPAAPPQNSDFHL